HLTEQDRLVVRRLFVDLVLETDPATNFDYTRRNATLHQAVACTQWASVQGAAPCFQDDMEGRHVAHTRYTLLALIIKLADLSNPFRQGPQSAAEVYAECIMREFYKQGDVEKIYDHCVRLANHQDRRHYPSNICTCQIAFIVNLAQPLLSMHSRTLLAMGASPGHAVRGDPSGPCVESCPFLESIQSNLEANMAHWTAVRERYEMEGPPSQKAEAHTPRHDKAAEPETEPDTEGETEEEGEAEIDPQTSTDIYYSDTEAEADGLSPEEVLFELSSSV
ncbi:hypothetical protein KIPB_008073, partial [Kipferlia bialata]